MLLPAQIVDQKVFVKSGYFLDTVLPVIGRVLLQPLDVRPVTKFLSPYNENDIPKYS